MTEKLTAQQAKEHHSRSYKKYYRTHKTKILEKQKQYLQTDRGKQNKIAINQRENIRYPEKYKARYTLRNAIRTGLIKRGTCEVCGNTKTEAHHDDYSKPFEVKWLCHKHHCELEGRWVTVPT